MSEPVLLRYGMFHSKQNNLGQLYVVGEDTNFTIFYHEPSDVLAEDIEIKKFRAETGEDFNKVLRPFIKYKDEIIEALYGTHALGDTDNS